MTKTPGKGQYDEVVTRLEVIVQALEAGDLTLEASLERFAEGITLVKQGEGLLAEAEKRIEQLLSDDGRTAPVEVKEKEIQLVSPTAPLKATARKAPVALDEDDVPF